MIGEKSAITETNQQDVETIALKKEVFRFHYIQTLWNRGLRGDGFLGYTSPRVPKNQENKQTPLKP